MERKLGPGETTPAQGEKQQRSWREPHERDESSQSQAQGEPSHQDIGEIAQQDVERGVQDTTKQQELEKTYDKLTSRRE